MHTVIKTRCDNVIVQNSTGLQHTAGCLMLQPAEALQAAGAREMNIAGDEHCYCLPACLITDLMTACPAAPWPPPELS
jgi:hypothetical protein